MVNGVESDSSALLIKPPKYVYDIVTINNDLNAITNWIDQWRLKFSTKISLYVDK